MPADYIKVSDTTLPNGIRLIVKTDRDQPDGVGARRREARLRSADAGRAGGHLRRILNSLFSYGTQTLDRLAFHKALDDIAANETAGYTLLCRRPQGPFLARRGVARRQRAASGAARAGVRSGEAADLAVRRRQSRRVPSTGLRARSTWRCCRPAIRSCGKSTPATVANVTLDDVKQYHTRHHPPRSHHDRRDRRRVAGGSEVRDREMVRRLEGSRPEARHRPCRPSRSTSRPPRMWPIHKRCRTR